MSVVSGSRLVAMVFSGKKGPTSRDVDIYAYRAYTHTVSAEFDPKKDAANVKKHGVSLSEGDGVLNYEKSV